MLETPSIPEKLKSAWEKVNQIFLPHESWFNDDTKCRTIQKKLSYFNLDHQDNPEHIDLVYKFLIRGVNLTQAAIDWENPAICGSSRTDTGKLRGIQWRLVIAYSGFEITTKGLMNCMKNPSINSCTFRSMMNKSNLPEYPPLDPPVSNNSKNLDKWLNREDAAIGQFMGLREKEQKIIQHWMVESRPIDTWEGAFHLAKALRNTTTHGFLVPRKVKDWELKSSFKVLTENLAEILVAALEKLES